MTTVQRIDIADVSDWIALNLDAATRQMNDNPTNQCARDVHDRWRICGERYNRPDRPVAEKARSKR